MRPFLLLVLLISFFNRGHGQVEFDGNITEASWGMPIATSLGGPNPCFGAGFRLNSLFASANNEYLMFGIGGNVQANAKILLFIDSRPGGFANSGFGRTAAPAGLLNLSNAIQFDEEFYPDECLVIAADNSRSDYNFYLYALSGSSTSGGGPLRLLGTANSSKTDMLGANAWDNDNTRGFEIAIHRSQLGFDAAAQQEVKLMAMIVSDAGNIDNQFLSSAAIGESCLGNKAVDFRSSQVNPVSYKPDQLLPINFSYFRFAQRNSNIVLLWASALENNMLKYEIQRSGDAIVFTSIGEINARGATSGITEYEFPDAAPLPGKNFYRIKAIDRAGRSAYSQIVKVQFGYVDNTLGIFPNPVKNTINLQLIGIAPGKYYLTIYNDAGQRMYASVIEYNGGYGLQQIPVPPGMNKGPYRLLLSNKSLFFKQSFVVQ
jgi:hypothetical protein